MPRQKPEAAPSYDNRKYDGATGLIGHGTLNIIPWTTLFFYFSFFVLKRESSHNSDTLLYEFDMSRVFQLRKESEGGGLTAFKTLHELDSARGIFNCCSLSFTDVFQYYDVKQATHGFSYLIFSGMNQNLSRDQPVVKPDWSRINSGMLCLKH